MAMPRYRYAIGQAPVRFPSLTARAEDAEKANRGTTTTGTAASQNSGSVHAIRKQKSSTSLMPELPQRRDDSSRERLQTSRKKAKSMHEPADRRQSVSSTTEEQGSQRTPRTASSRRNSLLPPSEKTPLTSDGRGAMKQQTRPDSASISCSSRPSSLFWTGPDDDNADAKQPSRLAASTSAYGSMDSSNKQAANDDPYGYRALAGPSLLPTYHEQQMKQQKENEVKSRVCGPNIACLKRNKWTIIGLAATLTTLAAFCYIVLLLL